MRLLVGVDGGDGGRDALELARLVASEAGASVLVACVVPYGPLPVDFETLARFLQQRLGFRGRSEEHTSELQSH